MDNRIKIEEHNSHKLVITGNKITCLTCCKDLIELTNKVNSIEIKEIFKFDDLPENSKKLAIEKYQELYDSNDWQLITEYGIDNMADIGINDLDLTWQLDSCQSDFVAITGNIYLADIISLITNKLNLRQLKNIKKIAEIENIRFEIIENNIEYNELEYKNIDSLLNVVFECFKNYLDDRMYKLKEYMQNEINILYSDEYTIETINCNEYKFYLDGSIA